MQIKAGDLVKLHPEFRHTDLIEGNPDDMPFLLT